MFVLGPWVQRVAPVRCRHRFRTSVGAGQSAETFVGWFSVYCCRLFCSVFVAASSVSYLRLCRDVFVAAVGSHENIVASLCVSGIVSARFRLHHVRCGSVDSLCLRTMFWAL